MTDLEIADAIRREYDRWDAEDVAEHPRPVGGKADRLVAQLRAAPMETEEDEAIRQQALADIAAAEAEEQDAEDAYGQAREERWAARRAEFLTELGVG